MQPHHAEVDQQRDEVAAYQYVVRLDVSMYDVRLVAVVYRSDQHVQLEFDDVQRHCHDRAPLGQGDRVEIHEHHVRWNEVL